MSGVDMEDKTFEAMPYGKAALKKWGEVPENFRIFRAERMGYTPAEDIMKLEGAEFRAAKSGPNKGKLCIMVEGTQRTAYVTREEINACAG